MRRRSSSGNLVRVNARVSVRVRGRVRVRVRVRVGVTVRVRVRVRVRVGVRRRGSSGHLALSIGGTPLAKKSVMHRMVRVTPMPSGPRSFARSCFEGALLRG